MGDYAAIGDAAHILTDHRSSVQTCAAQDSTVFIKANCLFCCQLCCLLLGSVQLFSSLSYLRDTGVLKKITVCYHYGCYNQQDNGSA